MKYNYVNKKSLEPVTNMEQESKIFLKRLKEQNVLNFFMNQFLANKSMDNCEMDSDEDSEFSEIEDLSYVYDKEKDKDVIVIAEEDNVNMDMILQTNADFLLTTNKDAVSKVSETLHERHKRYSLGDPSSFRLTNDDINVLNKIVKLSMAIIIISTFILIIGILMETTSILASPSGTITIICISFYLEIITFFFIFKLFISEINSSEYENLKIIGDIDNFLKGNKKHTRTLNFNEVYGTIIHKRFTGFMNIMQQR